MASGLGMLKHLPCPAGKNCTAFQCLFKHEDDDNARETEKDPVQSSSLKKTPPRKDEEAPRKRMKLSTEPSHKQEISSKHFNSQSGKHQPASGSDKPHTRSISNIPGVPGIETMSKSSQSALQKASLGRSTQQSSRDEATTTPSRKYVNSALSRKPADNMTESAKTTSKANPKKPETLNPRHLTKSPAKYDIRWKLVKLLHEQYTRLNTELKKVAKDEEASLIMTDQELIVRTLDEEEDIAIKKSAIYGNVVKNRIMNYKRMTVQLWKAERTEAVKQAKGEAIAASEAHKHIETGLNPQQEVDFLRRLSSDLKGLERFGYVATVPRDEDVVKAKQAVEASGNIEVCDRCTRRFSVFPGRREEDGALTSGGPCVHHPGKAYFVERALGDKSQPQKKWRCCQQTVGDTDGCTTGNDHVFKITDPNRLGSILGFVETPPNPNVPVDRAVCFDCEMGYTVYGLELIRLTAVSWPAGDVLLDVLVYPIGEYIDLNTRYSGVRPEDMVGAERWRPGDDPSPSVIPSTDPSKPPQQKLKLVDSPAAARDLFFNLISPETPLIGHGLENDLNAMRIIHPVIVDTVLLFPHKRGLPIRNGLKWLMETMLGRKIQMNTEDEGDKPQGHDSAEDARAAGELVRLKVRDEWEKLQMKGWTADKSGALQPPDNGWTLVGGNKKR